jgi:hypothetical protein
MVKLFKLKTSRLDDLLEVVGELLGAQGTMDRIVLHATTGFHGTHGPELSVQCEDIGHGC